jgi:hypothetical protein
MLNLSVRPFREIIFHEHLHVHSALIYSLALVLDITCCFTFDSLVCWHQPFCLCNVNYYVNCNFVASGLGGRVQQFSRTLSDVGQQPNATSGKYVSHSASRKNHRLIPLDDSCSKTNTLQLSEPRSASATTKSAALHLKNHAAFIRPPKVGFGDWLPEGLVDDVVDTTPEMSPEAIVSVLFYLLVE